MVHIPSSWNWMCGENRPLFTNNLCIKITITLGKYSETKNLTIGEDTIFLFNHNIAENSQLIARHVAHINMAAKQKLRSHAVAIQELPHSFFLLIHV